MTNVDEMYKCEICGNLVTVIESGKGTLVCCGQDMKLLEEKTSEQEGNEKHVPVVEIDGSRVIVKIGSTPHPMEEDHHIETVQLTKDKRVIAEKRLSAKDEPKAEFCLDDCAGVKARILCNVHGLWRN